MEYLTDKSPDDVVHLWLAMVKELEPEAKPNVDWWKTQSNGLMETGRYLLTVAVDHGAVIGFCDGFIHDDPVKGEVVALGFHFYVMPEYRNSVVSDNLYRANDQRFKKKGITVVETQCSDNKKRFWERAGFKTVRTVMRRD